MLQKLLSLFRKAPAAKAPLMRSAKWPAVRDAWLKDHPTCAACGARDKLNVHHKRPFHLFPAVELAPANFVTLCEGDGCNCHLAFGHALNWSAYNPHVDEDAARFLERVKHRLAADQ